MSNLVFKSNKVSYSGFEEVEIFRDMNSISGSFALSISNYFKGGTSLSEIKIGDPCTVEIEGQKVLDGYIDKIPVKYGRDYSWLDIVGRDKTCDLLDCSFDTTPNEWKKQTVGNIIKNLCNPFSISVTIDASVSSEANTKLDTYKANEGQTVYESIAELCRDNAIMPLNIGDGKLTLTKATTSKYMSDGIATGINIDSGFMEQSNENRFSSYKIKGQGIGNDDKAITDFSECYGSFSDPLISRARTYVGFAELPTNIGGCQKKAKWEARVRAGISRAIEYQIPRWVQSNNKVWEINSLMKVKDDIFGIDTTMLIMSIRYLYSRDEGEFTRLVLVNKDTYNLSDNQINIKTKFDR
jgi:prophage tail gpP-like protein